MSARPGIVASAYEKRFPRRYPRRMDPAGK